MIDIERLKALHVEGKGDVQIAEALGVTRDAVRYWRCKLGLPSNYKRLKKVDVEKLKALHAEGKSDSEIGKALGVSKSTIKYWRRRFGLAPNLLPGKGGRPKITDVEKLKKLYYESRLPVSEIAKMLGVSLMTVYNTLKKIDGELFEKNKRIRHVGDIGQKIIEFLKNEGYARAKDIAKVFGIHENTCEEYLSKLVAEGKVKILDLSASGAAAYKAKDLFTFETPVWKFFYVDDFAAVKKLAQYVPNSADYPRAAYTQRLKHSGLSDEAIELFHKLCLEKKQKGTNTNYF